MARLMLYHLTAHALTIAEPKWCKTCIMKMVAQALTIDMARCCVTVRMRTVAPKHDANTQPTNMCPSPAAPCAPCSATCERCVHVFCPMSHVQNSEKLAGLCKLCATQDDTQHGANGSNVHCISNIFPRVIILTSQLQRNAMKVGCFDG